MLHYALHHWTFGFTPTSVAGGVLENRLVWLTTFIELDEIIEFVLPVVLVGRKVLDANIGVLLFAEIKLFIYW